MKKIIIWGTGNVAKLTLFHNHTLSAFDVIGFIDNDRNKQGSFFLNKRVYAPDVLNRIDCDYVIVLAEAFDDICKQIEEYYPKLKSKVKDRNFFLEESFLKRYANESSMEIEEVMNHIREFGLQVFNYRFTEKYRDMEVDVCYDENNELFYINYNKRKMYFSRSYDSVDKVKEYYKAVIMEQDAQSPHRYLSENFNIDNGAVVVDAGVAEGNFALDIIDKASKIFIIETDPQWIEALRLTFKDDRDKVIIIEKYLTSYCEGDYATLDSLVNEPVDFIKMDIEGNEWDALLGSSNLFAISKQLKCAICAYHTDYDEILIKDVLTHYGMKYTTTKGYMCYPYKTRANYVSTKLHRGIVRGWK